MTKDKLVRVGTPLADCLIFDITKLNVQFGILLDGVREFGHPLNTPIPFRTVWFGQVEPMLPHILFNRFIRASLRNGAITSLGFKLLLGPAETVPFQSPVIDFCRLGSKVQIRAVINFLSDFKPCFIHLHGW